MDRCISRGLHLAFLFAGILVWSSCAPQPSSLLQEEIAVIPLPVKTQTGNGYFRIDSETVIEACCPALQGGAIYLKEMLSAASSFELAIASGKTKNRIILEQRHGGSAEGYSLKVSADEIRISANSSVGIFYGFQTLRQLLPPSIEKKDKSVSSWEVPVVEIEDDPVYPWRGMHLDVSRHFFSVDFLKQFIDRLSLYKFNKLHLHLTDDQGWRFEIKQYPELTENGAWRKLNNQDSVCLKRAASNSDFALPEEFFKNRNGEKVYGGFYTQEEMKDIVAYASERYVTIVPEIDMPGHMNAAILSNPDLTCIDGGGWGKLFTIPLCPCEESTYTFIENVLKEVATVFPGEFLHIGADEVDESSWLNSSSCKALMKKYGYKSTKELHGYFVNRVNKIVNDHGKKTIGWDEIVDSGTADTSVTVMYWRAWVKDVPQLAVSRGHTLIMSPVSHCYFDYEPDNSSLQRVFDFDPAAGLESYRNRIMGLQANIWTEYIPTASRLDYMTMPRMIALAENGWSKTKNWNDFEKRMSIHYARLDTMNIHYRLPDIPKISPHKVFIDTANVKLVVPSGVTAVHYTIDGTEPTANSPRYTEPFVTDSSMTLKILTVGIKGRSGNRYTVRYEKQSYLEGVAGENLKNGLRCRYYEGEYSSVTKILEKDMVKQSEVNRIEFPSYARKSVFALEFQGLIDVPVDGIYTFYLSSDDGSTLQIGDRMAVNHDGFHGNVEKSGQVALGKGLHPFLLRYFDGGGGNDLRLLYEGPGIEKQQIPESSFKLRD